MNIITKDLGLEIVLHVMILLTFLSIFYIYYISEISKNSFDKEIGSNIDKLAKKAVEYDKEKKYLSHVPYDDLLKIFEGESDYLKTQNLWLFGSLKAVLITMWIVFIGFIFLLKNSCGSEIDIMSLVKNNAATFILIGIVEYMFFTRVAVKFIPIAPSVLVKSFFSELKQRF